MSKLVFPTHVGVFLCNRGEPHQRPGLPHARGGVSVCLALSPLVFAVFPTHVGVFLWCRLKHRFKSGLPHARGGVSRGGETTRCRRRSSPRTWGCFTLGAGLSGFGIVFPTHVGGRQAGVAPESPFPTVGAFHVCP